MLNRPLPQAHLHPHSYIRPAQERRAPLLLTLLVGLCVTQGAIEASPFEVYGVGARASALGNTGGASARDYSAVHYNPAALAQARHGIGGGMTYALKALTVSLTERPTGYDIPNLGALSPSVPSEYTLEPRRGQDSADHTLNLWFGASTDLGTKDFSLGALVSLPVYHSREQYSSGFPDERERLFSNEVSFTLLGGRVEHFVVQLGAAYRVAEWLSLGLGASVMPDAFTQNAIYMPDASQQDEIELNVGVRASTRWRLQGGMLFTPQERLSIGVSYRDEQYMSVQGQNVVQVRGLQEGERYPFVQEMNLAFHYSPRQFTYGASWRGERVGLSADLVYSLWSDYQGQHLERAPFTDTWSPRAGLSVGVASGQELRLGARYEPTPVPPQTGRTNYVDNHRAVLSLGSGHELELYGKLLRISWHAQGHLLLGRVDQKSVPQALERCESATSELCDEVPDDTLDPVTRQPAASAQGLQTGNPGFPGFSSGGWLTQVGVEVSWSF